MEILGIGHVAMRCRYYDETLRFYTEGLGGRKAFDLYKDDGSVWITYVDLGNGQFVELFPMPYEGENLQSERSFVHMCLEIDDFPRVVRRLRANGVQVTNSGRGSSEVPEPLEQRVPGLCGSLCAFVTDPEGNDVELMQFTAASKQINGGECLV